MARIGGRSTWIALPAGLLCAGVVGALLWLAAPMVPVTVAWVGDSLRAATDRAAQTPADVSSGGIEPGGGIDCRDLYPSDLWTELVWTPQSLLAQTTAAPTTAAEGLADALAPVVERTCTWTGPAGTITSTLAQVDGDAATVAQATLAAAGFDCATTTDQLACTRSRGAVREDDVMRGGLWLSSVQTGWQPEDYSDRLTRFIWGG
ncbi:hypothetical protein ACFQRL_00575 [Microbacterium fluvii]|uniref:Uncharacterized protein n=1 Tax=Microbacterium fluvii TaxID=415215 RepID=A0ABW2H8M6_9MICO|nr:hypothetical protein [Microbacterium fluvii]MCU4671080.1 hypothetical protein [Microbacterium fluvii]